MTSGAAPELLEFQVGGKDVASSRQRRLLSPKPCFGAFLWSGRNGIGLGIPWDAPCSCAKVTAFPELVIPRFFVKIDSKKVNSGAGSVLNPSVALLGGDSTDLGGPKPPFPPQHPRAGDPSAPQAGLGWAGTFPLPCPRHETEAGCVDIPVASPSLGAAWPRLKLFISR